MERVRLQLPTNADGDIVLNVSEMFNFLHQELQKAREEEWERIVKEYGYFLDPVNQRRLSFYLLPHFNHSELKDFTKE